MKDLDFSKIDLIVENAKLKLDVVKAELTQREKVVIKIETRCFSARLQAVSATQGGSCSRSLAALGGSQDSGLQALLGNSQYL